MGIFVRLLLWSTIGSHENVHFSLDCVHVGKPHVSQLCIAVRHPRLTLWLMVQRHLVLLLWACVESCLPHWGLETHRRYLGPSKLFRGMSPWVTSSHSASPPLFPKFTFYIISSFAPGKSMACYAMWTHTQRKTKGVRLWHCYVSSCHVSEWYPGAKSF